MSDDPEAAAEAYAHAEMAIAEAKAVGAKKLWLDGGPTGSGFDALATIPPDIADLSELTELYLDNARVADASPLAMLTNLQNLFLHDTYIADATPLTGLKNLQTLSLRNTLISDAAPLAGLISLQMLDLSDTEIVDAAPLAGLKNLQQLFLRDTKISDVDPLAGLSGLEYLNLNDTKIRDLRPLVDGDHLIPGHNTLNMSCLCFLDIPATQLDPQLRNLSEIADDTDRTRRTLAYLRTLGDDWPPIPENVPEQEALLPVVIDGDRFEIASSRPSEIEAADRVKRKAHERLTGRATALARLAGNRYMRLAEDARSLCTDLDRDFAELDMLDIHFALEELRGTYERRAERSGDDAFTPDVVDALDKALMLGPGLTLDNADVQELEERRDRYRGRVPDPDRLTAQDALSASVAGDPKLFGDRLRTLEAQVQHGSTADFDRLRVGQEAVNRNVVILAALTVAQGMMGGPLSAMGNQAMVWLATQADTLTVLMPGWGQAMTAWLTPILMRAREACQAGRHLMR